MSKVKLPLAEIRRAFADYRYSEGCSCCRNQEAHDEAAKVLAKLLRVPAYTDGSGYDFGKFRCSTKEDRFYPTAEDKKS